jgi:uncharacterized protein YkwD
MRKSIKSLLVVLCVVAVFISITAFSTKSIDVLGVTVTNNSSDASALPKASQVSDYENAIAAMINNIRVANGLNALAFDGSLNDVAKVRSQDLIDRNYFSHYTPEGTNVFNLMKSMNVGYRYAGENLAQCAPASIGTPEAFLNAWMNSPTHMANILRAQYTLIGVSMVEIDSRRVVTTVFTN